MNVCFRCDASERTGYGHLMRCLAIADAAGSSMSSVFAMAGPGARTRDLVGRRGYRVIALAGDAAFDSASMRAGPAASDAVVFDLSHDLDSSRRASFRQYVNDTADSGALCVLIDGLAAQAAVADARWKLDLLVIPYSGAAGPVEDYDTLAGPQFAVLPEEFNRPGKPRRIAGQAQNILVTFGGSDPSGLSLLAIDALLALDMPGMQVRIVIGPGFADDLADRIQRRTAHRPAMNLLLSPASLAEHMGWADIAIAATGLTKYELARAGLPSILLSIDATHAAVHKAFDDAGTAWHLGAGEEITVDRLSGALLELTANAEVRGEMSRNGQALVDGRGAARIVDHIKQAMTCRTRRL